NAVAWNNVDAAEDPAHHGVVWQLNAEVPRVMAEAAKEAGAAFVHYSTDYVFPGTKPEGYHETDVPQPISKYGESKLAGEYAVQKVGGQSYICRLSKLFGRPGSSPLAKPNFVNIMVKLAKTKPSLTIVDEEVGMPTYTKDIAVATMKLITDGFEPGIYHLVNEGPGVTWYGFAEEFFEILDSKTPRTPVPSSQFPKPAARPKHAALINTKFPLLRTRRAALVDFFKTYPEFR
ncbi:MAG: sugar nucleotide-binding protein, partial [bacterium]|nr:sugar nucleotide-binding protein [bacterium]